MGAMESIVTLIAGGIVTWSIVKRYQTINSSELIENTRVTIGVFFAFVLGSIMLNPEKEDSVIHIINHSSVLSILSIISPFFIISIFQVLKGYHFSYVFHPQRLENAFFWIIDHLIIICICLFIILTIYGNFSIHAERVTGDILFALDILSISLFVGFIHSIFGTIIAGVNIAMILAHFFLEGTFGASLGSVFDFFEMVGISSMPMKWAIILISTFLGIHSAMSLDDMRNGINSLIP